MIVLAPDVERGPVGLISDSVGLPKLISFPRCLYIIVKVSPPAKVSPHNFAEVPPPFLLKQTENKPISFPYDGFFDYLSLSHIYVLSKLSDIYSKK